jgi:hypothetical protein
MREQQVLYCFLVEHYRIPDSKRLDQNRDMRLSLRMGGLWAVWYVQDENKHGIVRPQAQKAMGRTKHSAPR